MPSAPTLTSGVELVNGPEGYRLYRHGQPFFVRGAAGQDYVSELAAAGGNTMRIYDPKYLPAALAEAEKYGIAIIADIPLPKLYLTEFYSGERLDSLRDHVTQIVETYRDHPALLFWMMGNELYYSDGTGESKNAFNDLVLLAQSLDPKHPVSTAVVAHELVGIKLSLRRFRPDFVSINVFGNIEEFRSNKNWLDFVWAGPYLISEWGNNGYWESPYTAWRAPLEDAGAIRAQQLAARYREHISAIDDGRCLGNLAFFWGKKQERTLTWFSFFDGDGNHGPRVAALAKEWSGIDTLAPAYEVNYLLINGKGPRDNLIVMPGQDMYATVAYRVPPGGQAWPEWNVYEEDWYKALTERREFFVERFDGGSISELYFTAPEEPGPYRLSFRLLDGAGRYDFANFPFYVVNEGRYE